MRRFISVPDLCHVLAQIGTNRDKLNLKEFVTNWLFLEIYEWAILDSNQ